MNFVLKPYYLTFKHPFELAHGTRTGTQALFLRLSHEHCSAFSEATFPPYIPQTVEKSQAVLAPILQGLTNVIFDSPKDISNLLNAYPLDSYTRNLLCNALFDLNAKAKGMSLSQYINNNHLKTHNQPATTLTVTKSDLSYLAEKLTDAQDFDYLKLKLNGHKDIEFVNAVVEKWNKPFCVDVNQGWETLDEQLVLDMVLALKLKGCILLEQPFAHHNYQKHQWLTKLHLLPVYADESIQNLEQLQLHSTCFDGFNLKLLKCGGIDNAMHMIEYAKQKNKKIIVGCMSESSCGCATAYALEPYCHFLDIDGPFLISNDPFVGLSIKNGIFEKSNPIGIGVNPRHDFF